MRKLLVLPCFAGLCNRLMFINKLRSLAAVDPDTEMMYFWSLLDSRAYPSKFTSFYDVFKADLNIKLLENEDTYKSISALQRRTEYANYAVVDDLAKMGPEGNYIKRSGCIGSDIRVHLLKKYGRSVPDMMMFGKDLLMTDRTKGFYNKLEAKYLDIFQTRRIVFIRSNSDYRNKFNEICRLQTSSVENPFYIHDACDEASYANMLERIPGAGNGNSFNMFDLELSRTDRFVNIVALLFLCLRAKYEIVNFGGYSTYGTQMKINSKVAK